MPPWLSQHSTIPLCCFISTLCNTIFTLCAQSENPPLCKFSDAWNISTLTTSGYTVSYYLQIYSKRQQATGNLHMYHSQEDVFLSVAAFFSPCVVWNTMLKVWSCIARQTAGVTTLTTALSNRKASWPVTLLFISPPLGTAKKNVRACKERAHAHQWYSF